MIPSVAIRKIDFQTGVVKPSDDGILAIIAAAAMGPVNTPVPCTSDGDAFTMFGDGPLTEYASYVLAVSGNPVVLIRSAGSTAASYGTITEAGAGTSVITGDATTLPLDNYPVRVTFVTGGTVGTAGITYTYNLSSGAPASSESAIQALGTANKLTIPNTGVVLDLGTGTVLAGQQATLFTTRPEANSADVTAALEALRATALPWECFLVDTDADNTISALAETWILARNAEGLFPTCFLNTRFKTAVEGETGFLTAMTTISQAGRGPIDVVFCADGCDITSTLTGITQRRPTSLVVAARAMGIPIGTEPAYVGLGPLDGVVITDVRGNPNYHNEAKYPGLDDLGFTTLRSFSGPNGIDGVFVTNTRLFSPQGSDYQWLPQGRTINAACGIAFQVLTQQLSKGLAKNPKPGPGGARYIAEYEAQRIESLANAAITRALSGQADALQFSLSRTDDISSNAGATLTASLSEVSFAYAKKFNVTAGFVKSIS